MTILITDKVFINEIFNSILKFQMLQNQRPERQNANEIFPKCIICGLAILCAMKGNESKSHKARLRMRVEARRNDHRRNPANLTSGARLDEKLAQLQVAQARADDQIRLLLDRNGSTRETSAKKPIAKRTAKESGEESERKMR